MNAWYPQTLNNQWTLRKYGLSLKTIVLELMLNCIISWLTIGISNKSSVTETKCHSKTKEHKDPVDFRYVYLTIDPPRCMDNLDTRKTTQSMTLLDNWECCWDHSLTSNYSGKCGHHKNRPKNRFCNKREYKEKGQNYWPSLNSINAECYCTIL